MDRNRKLRALDDSELAAVNGGMGGGLLMKEVPLSSLRNSDLQYYLLGQCPICSYDHHSLDYFQEYNKFGCSRNMCVFVEG